MSDFRKLTRPEPYQKEYRSWQYILGKNNELRNKIAESKFSDEEKELLTYAVFKSFCYITLIDMDALYVDNSVANGLVIPKVGEIDELKD